MVQLDNGMLWKRHVDQLRGRDQSSNNNAQPEAEAAYASTDSNDENTNESSEISNGALTDTEATRNETVPTTTSNSVPARRYPDRVRQPPKRTQIIS